MGREGEEVLRKRKKGLLYKGCRRLGREVSIDFFLVYVLLVSKVRG